MPWPPANKVVGQSGLTTDLDWVYAWGNRQVFYIDDFGADPTGVALSDSAWSSAYAAATAAIQAGPPGHGAIIGFGRGLYKFSINTVQVTDGRIGLLGQGPNATTLYTAGNTGDLVYVCDTTGNLPTLPVGGFTCYGWNAGAGANGLHYGDRWYSRLSDVFSHGWTGSAFKFKNDKNSGVGLEGDHISGLVAKSSTVGYEFDGSGAGATNAFNYCEFFLHTIACGTAVKAYNYAHLYGNTFSLHGGLGSASFATSTVLALGTGNTDQTSFQHSLTNIAVEADSGSTTLQDLVVNCATGWGVIDSYGGMNFLQASGSYTAGAITSGMIRFNGPIIGSPLVNGLASQKKWIPFGGTRIMACDSTL